jgi:hypothetical protein
VKSQSLLKAVESIRHRAARSNTMLPINKGFNQVIPRSMANSGTELDECCGDITQSEVPAAMDAVKSSLPQSETGISLDEVFKKYERK